MRVVFLAFLLFCASHSALSQSPAYHPGTVSLAEGDEAINLELRYDPFYDKLYYEAEPQQEGVYSPGQLSGFWLAGARYYALPLAGGQPAFFKVLYEGTSFAVLEKALSCSLIQYLCAAYPATFEAQEDPLTGRLRLFYRSSNAFIADMAEELELESATFVATPSGLALFQLHSPAPLSSEDLENANPADQGLQMISLKKLFSSQQQFAQAKKIIRGNDLKLISPASIADAFRQIEAQL